MDDALEISDFTDEDVEVAVELGELVRADEKEISSFFDSLFGG